MFYRDRKVKKKKRKEMGPQFNNSFLLSPFFSLFSITFHLHAIIRVVLTAKQLYYW